jgi:hypothetical protein
MRTSKAGRNVMKSMWKIMTLAFFAFGVADYAVAQEMKDKTDQLVGTWTVVSVVNEIDGKKVQPFSSSPKGQFIFTADGHFSTNIVNPQHSKFASNNQLTATAEEYKEAVQGNISTFGTYAVNTDGSVNLEIIGSNFPNWDSTKQKRLVEIKGDEMTWGNSTASTGGTEMVTLQRSKVAERYPQKL